MLSYLRGHRVAILLAAALLALALPLLEQSLGQSYYTTFATRILIFALFAVSLDLIVGYGGMVSLGHAAFFGLGAYVAGIVSFHAAQGHTLIFGLPLFTDALMIWPLAILAAVVLALVLGSLSLRTRGFNFIMITLAFGQMVFFFFVSVQGYGGDDGLRLTQRYTFAGLSLESPSALYYLSALCLACYLALSHRIVNSRFGFALQAIRQNERRARALGYRSFGYKLTAFVIAAAGGALAGALLANQARFVSPDMLSWMRSAEVLIMVILGGMGSLWGPVLGAIVLLLLEEILIGITEHWQVILGPILLLVVLSTRQGIWGVLSPAKEGERD
ncbi:branched-chain amino acid ABC transporter permease [Eoetvoesiella caeni]